MTRNSAHSNVLAAALLFGLLGAVSADAADFTRFLSDPDFTILRTPDGKPLVFPGGHDEKYFAADQFGNPYKVRIKNPLPVYAEIGFSIVSEAVGLPNAPVYPALLQRGEHGLPSASDAKALDPGNTFMGLAGARGEYFPGSIQPAMSLQRFDKARLTPIQRAELLGQMIQNGIFGNNDLQFSDGVHGNIGFANGHFVTLDSTQAFKFYPEEAASRAPVIHRFLSTLPATLLEGMSPAETSEFVQAVNLTLSRFEKLNASDLERVMAPYIEGTRSFRAFKKLPEFDFSAELNRRIRSARSETLKYLEDRRLDPGALSTLRTPLEIPAPKISTPALRIRPDAIPSARDHAPVDLLWAHYFQDFWKARSGAEQKWAGELPGSNGNGIRALQQLAAKDQSRIYEVLPHMLPRFASPGQDRLPQTALNPKNVKTLVVVPVNDSEAEAIRRISQDVGVQVVALPEREFRHGSKLSESLAKNIAEHAKTLGIQRIIISELPGETAEPENILKRAGFEVIPIDHHTYPGMDRSKPISSLEQVAHALGYKLSPTDKAIAVNDRSFIPGLRDLGVPRESIVGPDSPFQVAPLESFGPIEKRVTSKGNLYILNHFTGKIGAITASLMHQDYPNIPNILLLGKDSLRFSGNPEVVKGLLEKLKSHERSLQNMYSGGDSARSMFWGMKGVPKEHLNEVVSTVSTTIIDSLGLKTDTSVEVLNATPPKAAPAAESHATPKTLSEILKIENPVERVNALKTIHGNALTPAEIQLAINQASRSQNSFEIAQMIRIADESKSPEWIPVLDHWLNEWKEVQRGWQTYQLEPAFRARIAIGAATGDRQCMQLYAKLNPARP